MRVLVTNQSSANHGRIGLADTAAWDRDDFWIPVVITGYRYLIPKRSLKEV